MKKSIKSNVYQFQWKLLKGSIQRMPLSRERTISYWANIIACVGIFQACNVIKWEFVMNGKLHRNSRVYLSCWTAGDRGPNSLKKSLICVREFLNLLCGRFNLILGKSVIIFLLNMFQLCSLNWKIDNLKGNEKSFKMSVKHAYLNFLLLYCAVFCGLDFKFFYYYFHSLYS
jgi:hypothetical protein